MERRCSHLPDGSTSPARQSAHVASHRCVLFGTQGSRAHLLQADGLARDTFPAWSLHQEEGTLMLSRYEV